MQGILQILNKKINSWLFILFMALFGCTPTEELKLFTLLSSEHTGVNFSNQLEEDPDFNIVEYMYYYDGGGVAVGDINNDGLKDLFFTANLLPNKLYLNKGDFVFEDISKIAGITEIEGWSTGVAMADVNGDGYLDIHVAQLGDFKGITGENQLYINNGDLTFTNKAKAYGVNHVGFSTQASFFDYDNDGDLDMYLLNHAIHTNKSYGPSTLRLQKNPKGDKLFRNDFEGKEPVFVDVTEKAGIYSSHIGYGLGITAGDLNNDGCIDIFISNDFHEQDYLYINNCDGTFTESLQQSVGHTSRSSMGNDLADFNNDGWLDMVVLDMLPDREDILKSSAGEDQMEIFNIKLNFGYYPQLVRNTLQLNQGNGQFSEIALLSGIHATDWSWTPLFCDLNNNGYKDLLITNGIPKRPNDLDYIAYIASLGSIMEDTANRNSVNRMLLDNMPARKIANFAFANNADLTFTNQASTWGLDQPGFSNGAAYADLDNDGDLDLVLNNINQSASIYRNNSDTLSGNNYLQVQLKGSNKNTSGIGAKVFLKMKEQILFQEQMPVRGFQSSVDRILHFGVGIHTTIDTLQVIWTNGKSQIQTNVQTNQLIILDQKDAALDYSYPRQNEEGKLFKEINHEIQVDYKHEENGFMDFGREYLMPHKLSTEGPRIGVGDVNGDGLDDIFLGGAKNQPSHLFLQGNHGEMVDAGQSAFMEDRISEDIDAKFFDVDGDVDLDLYVVSGGNEWIGAKEPIKDRLYLNDGLGNFSKSVDLLPKDFYANGSCVEPADFDGDGDIDLFVGSRSVVGQYGLNPRNYLLENDGSGKFIDVTSKVAPQLATIGMVTDAVWTDFDLDQDLDLIVVGEWMPITVFKNSGGTFENITEATGLDNSNGWWNRIVAADMDGDGDQDYVAGNLGLNSKIKASLTEPATLYLKDFDNNGSLDPILSFYKHGVSTPFATRDELIKQVNGLRKKFVSYADYAKISTIQDIFSAEQLQDALIKQAFNFQSSYIENLGNETFKITSLPIEAQFSPIFGFLVDDFDQDGNLDLLVGGNSNSAAINFGLYDASFGLLLKGDGKGDFQSIGENESGWNVKGEIRDIQKLELADGRKIVLAARNDDSLKIFKWKP